MKRARPRRGALLIASAIAAAAIWYVRAVRTPLTDEDREDMIL